MAAETDSAALVERLRGGDDGALEELAAHACRLALRTATAILADREEAGDLSQDVAVDVLRQLDRLRSAQAFDAWVHRITVRHAMRALKRRRQRESRELALGDREIAIGEDAIAGRADQLARIVASRRALATLPVKQQLALTLRYVHDLSEAEVAAALRCRPGTAASLLSRGRAALRADPDLNQLISMEAES